MAEDLYEVPVATEFDDYMYQRPHFDYLSSPYLAHPVPVLSDAYFEDDTALEDDYDEMYEDIYPTVYHPLDGHILSDNEIDEILTMDPRQMNLVQLNIFKKIKEGFKKVGSKIK